MSASTVDLSLNHLRLGEPLLACFPGDTQDMYMDQQFNYCLVPGGGCFTEAFWYLPAGGKPVAYSLVTPGRLLHVGSKRTFFDKKRKDLRAYLAGPVNDADRAIAMKKLKKVEEWLTENTPKLAQLRDVYKATHPGIDFKAALRHASPEPLLEPAVALEPWLDRTSTGAALRPVRDAIWDSEEIAILIGAGHERLAGLSDEQPLQLSSWLLIQRPRHWLDMLLQRAATAVAGGKGNPMDVFRLRLLARGD